MAIKKAYLDLYKFLTYHQDEIVADVLPELEKLMEAKVGGGGRNASNARYNEQGDLTHIFCYYHKMWEPVDEVEYGKKQGTATGLNSMCKEGLSQWTRQQSLAKKAKDGLLAQLAEGEVEAEDLSALLADIEHARNAIVPRSDGIGEADTEA
jgi:hypothetical protein